MLIERKTYSHWFIDTFESVVDLFSLLSFTLIIATLIYGTNSFEAIKQNVEIASVAKESGQPITVPNDTVVLILRYKNHNAILGIVVSGRMLKQHLVNKENVAQILRSEMVELENYKDFNLAVERENTEYLSGIFVKILILFDELKIKEYKQYFF